ncbi:MAG: carboxylesterase/lipase family protein [Dehalococcoidia bacterium]
MVEATTAIVETTSGKIEGVFRKGLYKFCGVPYAAPPVGERRWLPPGPPKPWSGVRPAKEFASTAPQMPMNIQFLEPPGKQPQSEDCLYLNIWTPGLDGAKRPVMVWVHGGGFVTGAGSWLFYNGRTLSTRGDVVVVTINYRLGALGFLNLNEVTRGKIPATGNEGLLDQVLALEWVRDNISRFGGDPDNVTAFGESAGAMSIGMLLAMPRARGLFRRAILESGAAHHVNSLEHAKKVGTIFLDILDIKPTDANKLRSLAEQQILNAQTELMARALDPKSAIGDLPLRPVVDGNVIPKLPIRAIAGGSADNVPVLVGTNRDEWKIFAILDRNLPNLKEAGLLRRCQQLIPDGDVTGLVEVYRQARSQRNLPITPVELLTAIQSDKIFRLPAIRLAEAHYRRQQPTYMYLFDWVSPVRNGILGACHGLDLGFVFGTLDDNFSGSDEEARALSRKIQDAWVSFARYGNPSSESMGKWKPYGERRETMVLGKQCITVEAPYDEERRAWEPFADSVIGSL